MNYRDIKAECYEANLLLPEYKLVDLTFGNRTDACIRLSQESARSFILTLGTPRLSRKQGLEYPAWEQLMPTISTVKSLLRGE